MTGQRRIEHNARKSLCIRESPKFSYCVSKGAVFYTKQIRTQGVPRQTEQNFLSAFTMRLRHIGEPRSQGRHIGAHAKAQMFDPLPHMPFQRRVVGQKVQHGQRIELDQVAPTYAGTRRATSNMDRTPKLVWRNQAVGQTKDIAESACEDTAHTSMLMSQVSTARSTAPAAPLLSVKKTPLGPMVIDPALVDRIAEDVIRRVERHVRIERERRGV